MKIKGGYLLHWLDDDNRHRYWAMPAELLVGDGSEYRRILLSRGMRLSNSAKARQLLSLFIQQMGELGRQKARFCCLGCKVVRFPVLDKGVKHQKIHALGVFACNVLV